MKTDSKIKFSLVRIVLPLLFSACCAESYAQQTFTIYLPKIDSAEKVKVIDKVKELLTYNYIFPETALEMCDYIDERWDEGEYDSISDAIEFGETLTEDLQYISEDKHLRINFNPELAVKLKEMEKGNKKEEDDKEFLDLMKSENFGFKKVEILSGNIGYADLRNFAPSKLSRETVSSVMGFLVNSDAIIFDLRQNGGGNPDGVQLICSYFFGVKPVHLNDLFSRPENKTEEFWTLEKVDGKRMPDVDLYVLTSKYTFSGGEEFAYNLKNLKRATIVGDVTGGGAHPGVTMRLNDNFIIFVPNGRAINPVTKTNWEGVGVQPDIKIQQEKALETAHILALEKIAKRKKESSAKKEIEWLIETLKSSLNPVNVEDNALQRYAGSYGDRLVTFENGTLYYQRKDRQKYELIPMSEDLFRLKDLEVFRIKFEKDKSGMVTGLTGLYSDGHSDKSIRTN